MARRNILANPDTKEDLSLDYDAAVKVIKASRNRQIFIGGSMFLHTKEDDSKGYRMPFNVPVSAAVALRVLDNVYGTTDKFKDECVVKLHVRASTLFIN